MTATVFVVASRESIGYGAPLAAERPPGTGAAFCGCGNHLARCRFGRQHEWTVWYSQGKLVATDEDVSCVCGAVCLTPEGDVLVRGPESADMA